MYVCVAITIERRLFFIQFIKKNTKWSNDWRNIQTNGQPNKDLFLQSRHQPQHHNNNTIIITTTTKSCSKIKRYLCLFWMEKVSSNHIEPQFYCRPLKSVCNHKTYSKICVTLCPRPKYEVHIENFFRYTKNYFIKKSKNRL